MTEPEAIVFVVDDDESVRESLGGLIRSAGLRVETFASAQQFLAGPRSEIVGAPRCLALDVHLPGLSGLDLQERMAELNIEIPIIFITGRGDIPTTVRAMKAGAVDFLTKPFRDHDLLDAIGQAIERDQAARRLQAETAELHGRCRQRRKVRMSNLSLISFEFGSSPQYAPHGAQYAHHTAMNLG